MGWGSSMRFGLFFSSIPDPRAPNARHDLCELLLISFAAVLCGAESCQDMADFGEAKEPSLRKFLQLRHGIPSHDTFSRVFRLLDPTVFAAAFHKFMAAFSAQLGPSGNTIAIDGKSLSGAFESGARATPLHLVTAWGTENRLVLGQCRAPGRNEVEGALQLVAMLDLEGTTVTADALHGNRKMARAIRSGGGHYVLALKGNRGPLHRAAKTLLAAASASTKPRAETAHGRLETRQAVVRSVPKGWAEQFEFDGLTAIARIDTVRRVNDTEERQSRYFVLSQRLTAAKALDIVRAYWGIENRQHWILDVVFDEDRARSRKDNAAENLALLRRLALNILQTDSHKASIRRKIKRAGWLESYLFSLLSQMR
jgi:predicted transposase YbfD/YdcC